MKRLLCFLLSFPFLFLATYRLFRKGLAISHSKWPAIAAVPRMIFWNFLLVFVKTKFNRGHFNDLSYVVRIFLWTNLLLAQRIFK